MVTRGDSPSGAVARSAATIAGRPTYDGVTSAPAPGGIRTQPSGTTQARPPTTSTAATQISATRRVGRSQSRTRRK